MGFKDFCENYNNTQNNHEQKNAQDSEENIKNIYNKYKDKNEDELLSELISNVNKQKQEGTFNIENITNMLSKISPYLTQEQSDKIKDILQKIN